MKMNPSLEKLLKYKQTDPKYVLTAFEYADDYAEGLFMRGAKYGFAVGIIFTLIIMAVIIWSI